MDTNNTNNQTETQKQEQKPAEKSLIDQALELANTPVKYAENAVREYPKTAVTVIATGALIAGAVYHKQLSSTWNKATGALGFGKNS